MGLFSFLFKKKKQEPKKEERHFIDDVSIDKKSRKSMSKTVAEGEKSEPEKVQPTVEKVEASEPKKPESAESEVKKITPAEDVAATKIAEDKNAESVKVKGFGGAFDIKKSRDGRYVFNLYAANRVIVATSQIYSSSQSAITGIKSVIANAERANVEDQTLKQYQQMSYPKWEIYVDKGGQYRWRLLATNGSCILHSQGYTQKSTCKKGIESVIRTAKSAKIDKSYLEK